MWWSRSVLKPLCTVRFFRSYSRQKARFVACDPKVIPGFGRQSDSNSFFPFFYSMSVFVSESIQCAWKCVDMRQCRIDASTCVRGYVAGARISNLNKFEFECKSSFTWARGVGGVAAALHGSARVPRCCPCSCPRAPSAAPVRRQNGEQGRTQAPDLRWNSSTPDALTASIKLFNAHLVQIRTRQRRSRARKRRRSSSSSSRSRQLLHHRLPMTLRLLRSRLPLILQLLSSSRSRQLLHRRLPISLRLPLF